MQERCNEVAAIMLELYVGSKRNAGRVVFIHTAALRGSLRVKLKQRESAGMDTETANLDMSVQTSLGALVGNYTYWWRLLWNKSSAVED